MKTTRTINVALCGPGDVAKEIELAKEAIHEWNQRNFDTLNCGVRPVHWDSDAVPSMRARGQEVINWDLIDKSDLVVAIFWQRLGTPTGMHDSGTAEEVNRAQARGIEVMLYFSDIENVRADTDPDQRDMLRAYRARAMQSGLPWTFQSRSEFRKRFADHLNKKVHEILARKPKKKSAKKRPSISQKQSGTGNVQIAGDENIVNVKVPRDSRGKSARDLPGTIGADADMRTYAQYLVDKYIKCRLEGEKRIQQYSRPFNPASAHGILGQGFGVTNSVYQISQSHFHEWVAAAQAKIKRTVFAKRLPHDIFHSWEEHLRQRGVEGG
jgi:nucleoside 2-deoxyribosyltransferase